MKIERMQELLTVVDEAIDRAGQLGFSPEEFSLTLYARTQTAGTPAGFKPVSVLFIECSRPELELFSSELRKDLSLRVDPMLVQDFKRLVERDPGS